MDEIPPPRIDFRLDDGTDAHAVPADVLAEVLRRAQRVVHLLAMSRERVEVRQRARVPSELAKRFTLLCEVPEPGSYVVPATIGDVTNGLFASAEAVTVVEAFKTVGEAVAGGRFGDVADVIPDGTYRRRVLDEFAAMVPAGTIWSLELSNGTGPFARLTTVEVERLRVHLRRLRHPDAGRTRTVAGQLQKVDFARHQITLRHHPTDRELTCEYAEEIEDMLLATRRDWLRVTGAVLVNERDEPVQITEVLEIEDLDLSDLLVETVGTDGQLRFADGPFAFSVTLDESGDLLVAEWPELGVHAFARTRDALVAELHEQLQMLWHEYALAAPATLDADAEALREALLEALAHPTADATTAT